MRKTIAIIVIIIILGVGAGLYLFSYKSKPTISSSTTSNTGVNATTSQNLITYSGNGFSPATLTVKAGTTVTIKNDSSDELQLDSNPHPVHTDDQDLNVGTVNAGESRTFTVNKTGSFGYHNHLNPSQTGHIVVE